MTGTANLAVAPVAIPLLAGVVLLLAGGPVARRWLSAAATLAQAASVAWLLTETLAGRRVVLGLGGWDASLGIVLVVDLFSAIMLGLSVLMFAGCQAFGFAAEAPGAGHPLRLPLWQFLAAGVNLSFVTGDLFNLFVAFEMMLIASYALLTLEADDWDVKQAFPYVLLNLAGGGLFLLAAGFVYGVFGTLNLAALSSRMGEMAGQPVVAVAALLLFAVFALKAGLFPLYYWLPGSYPILPAPLGAYFAGMLTKVGVYVLLRMFATVFPPELGWLHAGMGWLAAATMVIAVLGAVAGSHVRGILSFHILSQIGYMVLAIGMFTGIAIAGCVFYVIHHIVVKGTLFLAGSAAARARGGDDLALPGGVAGRHPLLAACFLVQALSLAGLPPLSGFWGKFVIFAEGLRAGQWAWVAAAAVAGVLTLFSMLKIWNQAFWGPPPAPGAGARVPAGMIAVCVALTMVSLGIGFGAGGVWAASERAAEQLLDRQGYLDAVLSLGSAKEGA